MSRCRNNKKSAWDNCLNSSKRSDQEPVQQSKAKPTLWREHLHILSRCTLEIWSVSSTGIIANANIFSKLLFRVFYKTN